MFMMPCVAPANLVGHEKAEECSSKLVQHSETQSLHSSETLTSQVSIITLNGLSSPISTLLEELFIIIFDDVITSQSTTWQNRCTDWRLSSPRNLASVSRTWRSVVFACPKLWRFVHLTPTQSLHALKEQLILSSPLPIHLTVHQWPFRNPIPSSGPFSIVALTAQLQSILPPRESQRVESITINATEASTFLNFVLQTWTGRGSRFPALRHVAMNGGVRATWSRACFFEGRDAPGLERLELSNVVIAQDAYRLPWGTGLNLTTLVWSAPAYKEESLVVPVSYFHRVVSSFPSLTTLELHEHAIGLEFATLENLEESDVKPLRHIRDLRLRGRVFSNPQAAYILFYLLPSLKNLAVRGRARSGPLELRTVTFALQGLITLPQVLGWPIVLPNVENIEMECVDSCEEWKTWCIRELELWRDWGESLANTGEESNSARTEMHFVIDKVPTDTMYEDV